MEDKKVCCVDWKNHKCLRIAIILFVVILAIFLLVKIFADIKSYGYIGTDAANPNTIVVSGTGKIYAKPDIAEISFSVSDENLDVSKATDAVNTKIAAIIAKLEADGVAAADIQTTDYSITPQYDYVNSATQVDSVYVPAGTQTLVGYQVTQSIDLKIRDISNAGTIVTDLGVLGATDMSGLSFTESNYDALVVQARDEAITDARNQAENLAKALGVKLGDIQSFSDESNPIYYANATMAVAMPAASGAIVQATLPTGENDIVSNVSITYEIK